MTYSLFICYLFKYTISSSISIHVDIVSIAPISLRYNIMQLSGHGNCTSASANEWHLKSHDIYRKHLNRIGEARNV